VATALAIVLFTWMAIRSERRWQRAVGALEAAPGIVLIRAERDGSRWRFDGLRDPLATEPAVLLAGAGADTTRIAGRWEPYLSLQPELVLARVRQRLTPPATVQLTLTGETVRLTGAAPLAWVAATPVSPRSRPGRRCPI
jgi:OOP family OmpA-OmpF porin